MNRQEGATGDPVVIAMLTFRRPAVIDAISAVLQQVWDVPDRRITLLVVDNDPAASARDLVCAVEGAEIRYVHEPRPGIAAARNRALDEAGDARLLIFIDDDERPVDRWLELLLATFDGQVCAGVVGPVISEYEHDLDDWMKAGRFFDRRRMPTGTTVDVAATNNLLLDLDVVRRAGLRFDETFGRSGGSDTLFTRSLVAGGARLIWCDEAVVVDRVPAARLTRRWVLQRAFRSGNSWSQTSLVLVGGGLRRFAVRCACVGTGSLRLAGGGAKYFLGLASRSLPARVRGIRTMARGAGMLAGAVGYRFHEYGSKSATNLAVQSLSVQASP